ncbi:LytR/AlgR family response regulator transcription factor (plasmid) [Pseudoalteromonas sp. T1lg65]|uniref:LytR/AlgR family response regulator transcription factor n=1 Tax=Pseudoalteromonas sp. T1lg65 TaxID=2077101 RepID=UPI003F798CF7
MIRVLVAEDETPARNKLLNQLSMLEHVEIVGEATTGKEALTLIEKLRPDVALLDIEMPELSGLDLLDVLDFKPYIIFTTAYSEFAVEAFEHDALDYLLKPFPLSRLKSALDKAEARLTPLQQRQPAFKRLVSKQAERISFVEPNDIYYISAGNSGAIAHTEAGNKPLTLSLEQLEQRLAAEQFVRLHRGYLVNLDHVKEIQRYFNGKLAVIINDAHATELITSRSGAEKLKLLLD